MKKQYINRSKPHTTQNHTNLVRNKDGEESLNRVAEELDSLARRRLPDRARIGILTSHESDIRQDSVILALSWYVRHQTDPHYRAKYPWYAPRAIAAALRFRKRDYIKLLKGEDEALKALTFENLVAPQHPALIRICDWSPSTKQTLILEAIRIALKNHRISYLNAVVGLGLLIECVPAREMATRLRVSRSAIYQHLSRVRCEVPDIIDGIEIPLNELL